MIVAITLRTCIQDQSTSEIKETVISIEANPEEFSKLAISANTSFEECSKITRGVLITFCGSCHQSSLDSHKAGAIKVFDLEMKTNWHVSLSIENLEGIARRTKNKNTTEQQKKAIATFLELKESQFETVIE